MESLPKLTEAILRQHASSESYQRGRDYYEQGAVSSLARRGRQLQAEVEGSQYEPYQVQIAFDAGGIVQATCSCPYDWGGWCKHIVATLLAYLHEPEEIEERPSVETLLAGLDREQLQTLLRRLVEQQPGLADTIEGQVQSLQVHWAGEASASPSDRSTTLAQEPAPGEPSPRPRRTPVDPTPFRRQVHSIFHSLDRMRPSEAYWHVCGVVNEVRQVLDQARGFVAAGDGRNALAILEAITEEYMDEWEELDDSDGEVSAFFGDLGPVWTEALLTADLTREERQAWAKKLAKWQKEVDAYGVEEAFEAAMAAAEQGWEYPPLLRVLQGEITEKGAWEEEAPGYADALAMARLNVLERQGRYPEYLYLAEAEGQAEPYVAMLVRLGRIQEAVDYGLQHLSTTGEALTLAKALREREELQAALRIAERGLGLGGPKASLAAWLADLALGMGEVGRALEAARIAFREGPDLTAYLRMKDLAGERWAELQPELLAHLRQGRSPYSLQGPVEIFLHEGLIEEAMKSVEKSGDYRLIERVADAAISSHPDWVIRTCRQQAEPIMDQGKSRDYHHAARWLEKARAAYRAAGRGAEWQAYLEEILARHRRKHSLVPLLVALKR